MNVLTLPPIPTLARLDPVLTDIYQRLGTNTLLVPIKDGACLLKEKELAALTLADSLKASHQNLLLSHEVAVMCGPPSLGLCGIQVHDRALQANPGSLSPVLASALVTETLSGKILWLRVTDLRPPPHDFPEVSWLSKGCLVRLRTRPPHPPEWRVLHGAIPVLTLEAIGPLAHLDLSEYLRFHLVEHRYGTSFTHEGQPAGSLNPAHWAAWLKEMPGVEYWPAHRSFRLRDFATKEWETVTPERLCRVISDIIHRRSRRTGPAYTASLKELRAVLDHLRIIAVVEPRDDRAIIRDFVAAHVEPQSGANTTTAELTAALHGYCQQLGLRPVARTYFELEVGAVLRERFGVRLSHSIAREGTARHGYRGVALKGQPPAGPGGLGGLGGEGQKGWPPLNSQLAHPVQGGKVLEKS